MRQEGDPRVVDGRHIRRVKVALKITLFFQAAFGHKLNRCAPEAAAFIQPYLGVDS
jgi:hypothetical protein